MIPLWPLKSSGDHKKTDGRSKTFATLCSSFFDHYDLTILMFLFSLHLGVLDIIPKTDTCLI